MTYRKLILPGIVAAVAFTFHAIVDPDDAPFLRALYYVSGIIAWLALAWLAGRFVDFFLYRVSLTLTPTHRPRLLNDLLHAIIYSLAVIAILIFVFQQAATGLIATSSILIAVVGFALRYIISDVFSGIAVNFDHPLPYCIGDWIEPDAAVLGRVDEITWRTTRLITRDGVTVIMPNGLLAIRRVMNYSQPTPAYRISVRLTLDPTIDVAKAKHILLIGALSLRGYPDLRPDVLVQEYNESGVLYVVRFWVPDAGEENTCRDAVLTAVLQSLHRNGFTVLPPRRQITTVQAEVLPPPIQTAKDVLDSCELFRDFTENEKTNLAEFLSEHPIKKDEVVVRRGDTGGSLYFVVDGVLEVRTATGNNPDMAVDRMIPGDIFGEISFLTGEPRSATLVALTDALLYQIRKADIQQFLWNRPELVDSLIGLMSERQQHNKVRLQALGKTEFNADDLATRFRNFFRIQK